MRVLRLQDKLISEDIVKKLSFKEVQILDDYLKAVEKECEIKDYITVTTHAASSGVDYADNAWLPFSTVLSQYGSKLTAANGGVRVGKGVSKVKVEGQMFLSKGNNTENYQWMILKLNNVDISGVIAPNTGGFCSVAFSSRIVDVKEGDLIKVWTLNRGTVRGGCNTFINVRVME